LKKSLKSAEKLSDKLEYDSRPVRTCLGYFYLCISKNSTNTMDLYKTRSLILILGSKSIVPDMI
jgi:hypothetical protein